MATLAPGRAIRALRGRGAKTNEAAGRPPAFPDDPVLPPPEQRSGTLAPAQIRFFETFGFLRLPGLFVDDIDRIQRGFEEAFERHQRYESHEDLHFNQKREILHDILPKSALLAGLGTDARALGVVESLIGEHFEEMPADGNLFSCDTSWHPDTYGSPLHDHHVKLSLYLDPLDGSSGTIRMMPGTNHWLDGYARTVRRSVDDAAAITEHFGVAPEELPSYPIESVPGDVVVWDYRTVHASFNGGNRRRLLSLNYKQLRPPAA
jgi:hypothetical protein